VASAGPWDGFVTSELCRWKWVCRLTAFEAVQAGWERPRYYSVYRATGTGRRRWYLTNTARQGSND